MGCLKARWVVQAAHIQRLQHFPYLPMFPHFLSLSTVPLYYPSVPRKKKNKNTLTHIKNILAVLSTIAGWNALQQKLETLGIKDATQQTQ